MVVIRTINIVPNIINIFPSAFSDLQNCLFFYPVQAQESSTMTGACFQLFCPLYFWMTIMLVIVLILHAVETTYFYGIYNRWHGSNENNIHDYYMHSIKLGTDYT